MTSDTDDQQRIQISTGDEMSRGRYSNSMLVGHGPEEFIIDWLLQSPSGAHLVSRIVVSPGHMKRIVQALHENLQKYEDAFGEIKVAEPGVPILQ
jgi:hypothetical protein